jgi:LPXTG-motif cell wall-anchored protein
MIWDETLDWITILGMVLIVFGGVLTVRAKA